MTETDKDFIISLWRNNVPISGIIRMLPYRRGIAKSIVKELRESGVLTAEMRKKETAKIIVETYKTTANPHKIAEITGYSLNTVLKHLTEAKLNRARPAHNYKKRVQTEFTDLSDLTQQIVSELKSGKVANQIAKKHNVSRQYVSKIKKKYLKEVEE